ncbi:PRAME family member 12-like [Perognathus longimembris pacificus]|uniref:PRAME family member 12-like n=1 Tax=Perognathus longimembris pacificus TaxID=214514 RepID=UPI002019BE25|nr:PRAME family member 12-like [Perognathus longimembris pacificus]
MSNKVVPRLLELAAHGLLSNEAPAMPALEEFTVDLFPPLFTATFAKGHKKALTALVQAWPFPLLRLGSLIVQWPNQESVQAVLDGLEAFPTHRTCLRRSELRVLDLTLDFDQVQSKGVSEALAKFPFWLPSTVKAQIPQATARRKPGEDTRKGPKQPWEPPDRVLKDLELNFIQELEVFNWFRALSEQKLFATQLGRICTLHSLKLAYYHWSFSPDGEGSSSYFLSQLSKLSHLQKLHLSYSYLSGNLQQVLSCLQAPLHALEIHSCTLLDTDINYLSQSFHATSLKKLDLSALCCCSQVSSLGLSDNPISKAGLLSLLEHTAGLMELKRVLYPIPIECCVYLHGLSWGPVNKGKLCQVQAEMQKLLQTVQRADMQWSPPLPSPLPVRLVQLD